VTTLMRTHSNFDTAPREPWRWGEPVNSLIKAQIEWRYRMMPTLYSLVAQAHRTGEPVLAPLYYHFPSDASVRERSTELMLGASLLVAPVLDDGARSRTLVLPAGRWLDLATNQRWSGGQTITVPAPLERLPLLAKAGAIIPMGPVRAYAGAPALDYLLLDIVAGDQGAFDLYEDDLQSTAYQQGSYRLTPLRWREDSSQADLSATASGPFEPAPRPWWIQVRDWDQAPAQVTVDGSALPQVATTAALPPSGGWTHDAAQSLLLIRAPGEAAPTRVHIQRATNVKSPS
jgi:alpha-glucosidase